MTKVLSASELAALLADVSPVRAPGADGTLVNLDDIVAPTADELLLVLQHALDDAGIDERLTGDQRTALHGALVARLLGALMPGARR